MVSSVAGLKAVVAIAVLAALVMSSQGHTRTKPLCSDCPSLCNTNCTAFAAANCSSDCGPPPDCDRCKSEVLQGCCHDFCTSSNGTNSTSCCPNDCSISSCTCSCDNCNATVIEDHCMWPCSTHADDAARCQACKNGAGQWCYNSCISDCNDHCTKKDC